MHRLRKENRPEKVHAGRHVWKAKEKLSYPFCASHHDFGKQASDLSMGVQTCTMHQLSTNVAAVAISTLIARNADTCCNQGGPSKHMDALADIGYRFKTLSS